MNERMTTIEVPSEIAELLKARAAARHLPLDEYLRSLTGAGVAEAQAELTPPERAKRWDEWTSHHSVRTPTPVDDSRESIYTREEEAL